MLGALVIGAENAFTSHLAAAAARSGYRLTFLGPESPDLQRAVQRVRASSDSEPTLVKTTRSRASAAVLAAAAQTDLLILGPPPMSGAVARPNARTRESQLLADTAILYSSLRGMLDRRRGRIVSISLLPAALHLSADTLLHQLLPRLGRHRRLGATSLHFTSVLLTPVPDHFPCLRTGAGRTLRAIHRTHPPLRYAPAMTGGRTGLPPPPGQGDLFSSR